LILYDGLTKAVFSAVFAIDGRSMIIGILVGRELAQNNNDSDGTGSEEAV
jgi:hypothetical protein